MRPFVIAVDFDGTCVEHMYPNVGPNVPGAAEVLSELVHVGHSLIIWTMRDGEFLDAARAWFDDHDIPVIGANLNPGQDWSSSPKAYAQVYIDDAALGCPLRLGIHGDRPMIDWSRVRSLLVKRGVL